jgi:DNA-binding transcriptional ArsR family regulator
MGDSLFAMAPRTTALRLVAANGSDPEADQARLDVIFQALSDATRRAILEHLDGQALLVSELAAHFDISLQGVSRHIQVLVRAGLIQQERTGRISRCSLTAEPLMNAAVWLNRYTKYWEHQFDVLALTLAEIDDRRGVANPHARRRRPPAKSR